jgi:hypothetical protein
MTHDDGRMNETKRVEEWHQQEQQSAEIRSHLWGLFLFRCATRSKILKT